MYKGDGGVLKIEEKEMRTVVGDGKQRDLSCKSCNARLTPGNRGSGVGNGGGKKGGGGDEEDGGSSKGRLMSPVEVVSASDGSLYIGDYNFIRKVSSDRSYIHNVLQLRFQI